MWSNSEYYILDSIASLLLHMVMLYDVMSDDVWWYDDFGTWRCEHRRTIYAFRQGDLPKLDLQVDRGTDVKACGRPTSGLGSQAAATQVPVLMPAYNFLKFTCNDVIAERALPVTFGEDVLLAFLGLALAHERSNATKTVTAAREEMAKTVYRGKSANSATRIG